MAIWVIRQNWTPEQQEACLEISHLVFDWPEFSDLSAAQGQGDIRRLVHHAAPDLPPETAVSRAQAVWRILGGLEKEDLILVPLSAQGEFVIGEINGPYVYMSEDARDKAGKHAFPIRWVTRRLPMQRLRKCREIFAPEAPAAFEVDKPETRTLIRDQMALGYNRFRKLKWLLGIAFLMQLVHLAGLLK